MGFGDAGVSQAGALVGFYFLKKGGAALAGLAQWRGWVLG